MPISTIVSQPDVNSLKAAYRPIELTVTATKTDGTAIPPVVYCDVYFNGVFYRTLSKSQYTSKTSSNSDWKFDIQDLVQEYLGKYLPLNGYDQIVEASPLITSIYCKFRSSGFNVDGYITPEGLAPIQGTLDEAPVSGTGTQSNTFYGINVTLQHYDVQDFVLSSNKYKIGTWDANTYPLTHRPNGYLICKGDSDWFPIVTDKTPERIVLNYRLNGAWLNSEITQCTDPSSNHTAFPNVNINENYAYSIALSGTQPFGVTINAKPAWMTIDLVGNQLSFSGTPTIEATENIDILITNCGNPLSIVGSFQSIDPAHCDAVSSGAYNPPNATIGTSYSYTFNVTGTAPFSLSNIVKPSWMTIGISGSTITLGGTPQSSDAATNVTVAFRVTNCGGFIDVTDTIDVIAAAHRDPSNYYGYAAAVNGICTVTAVVQRFDKATLDATAANETIRAHVDIIGDNGCSATDQYFDFAPTDAEVQMVLDVSCGGGTYCVNVIVIITSIEVI